MTPQTTAPRIGYANKDYASLLAALQDLAAQQMPEWSDQSPNDLGVMLLELFCALGDSLFYALDRVAAESFLDTAAERRSVLNHLRLIGYEMRPALPATADLTLLFAADATGPVSLPPLAVFKTTAAATGTPVSFQYIGSAPIAIDRGALPLVLADASGILRESPPGAPPGGATAYRAYRSLPVTQIDANISNEIVASSDGSAGQKLQLRQAPLVDATLVVRVDEGAGPAAWRRVDSLLACGPDDACYQLRRDETGAAWLEFGGGPYGRAPLRGFNNILASYSIGGGAKGNVPRGAISKPVTPIDKLKLTVNEAAASGGAEPEDIASAAARGPQQFRSGGRAVTAEDFVTLAQAFGVAKAQARARNWNGVDMVVAPAGGGQPSATLIQDLEAFLDAKAMLGVVLTIHGPVYTPVVIDATVFFLPQYDPDLVEPKVRQAVDALLAFDALDFNQTLYISKVYEIIQEVEGVAGVVIATFAKGPGAAANSLPANGLLTFDTPGELPQWLGFDGVTCHLGRG
jgi:uncharacterized phage protein gp47/JayE